MTSPLKHARIESGKTIEEVAAYLKIKKQYLIALEEGKLELIPAAVYVKGYLKLYSNYLRIPLTLNEEEVEQIENSSKQTILRDQYNQIIVKYKWKKHFLIISTLGLIIVSVIFHLLSSTG
ncbi:helix-turn-helix domain-containing protein [Candidatus Tisiphia endosymbiont of Beris chalybata]|uniref:helix-turn-helix domain-containing protein n=1 Tax=Candidatus Tisiphia endosymbiont of Beris chalybata TaxID=3066262 RepID=UPI00312C7325